MTCNDIISYHFHGLDLFKGLQFFVQHHARFRGGGKKANFLANNIHDKITRFWLAKSSAVNPLSQSGGGVVAPPPFRIFPRTIFAFLLRLPYGQFTYPLSRYPCICEKNFQKFLPWKKLGGGAAATNPPPSWEGRGGSKNKSIFVVFIFLFFPFVITMTMFLKYLRHKVDSVKCFTFNL